ncbi:phage tail assembly protein [Chromobacterium sphagni]|uniref:Phage tail protein n=1 Tax=Chromobacterium sphagni TaxID=1903179 RepID=A0A1S1WST2_9NEIS|nr:phage tail assembly protein [Chromobacterium sphagni]OHX10228.1 phage tail protein [Chromobacterium sphagni]OHX20428.1 phage tail protein [Chromobacterium sphagni]
MSENIITLDTPIKRGDSEITAIELRKPGAGELRGIKLSDLLQMDVSALHKVLPRITSPALNEQDVTKMDVADFTECASMVAAFLLKKSEQQDIPSPQA